MTAQIAIFNLSGVAVATDSTTTVGDSRRMRTFSGAQKLFDLGEAHRIVVMTSGEARLMRVPYQVLIPKWRDTLTGPLASIGNYADAFLDWLPQQEQLFSEEQQRSTWRWLLEDYYLLIRSRIRWELEAAGLADSDWDSTDVRRIVTETIDRNIESLAERELLSGVNVAADEAFISGEGATIREIVEAVFEDFPRTVEGDDLLLRRAPGLVISRAEPWDIDTTIAFIGYGSEDTFPGHQVVVVTGIVDNRLRVAHWEPAGCRVGNASMLTPFAQSEAIDTFLRAYNGDFPSISHDRISAIGEAIHNVEGIDESQRSQVAEIIEEAHEALSEDLSRHSWDRFIRPMLNTVESLPIAELARMAEALVGIQALRSHSSDTQPSVGGTIAVLTIGADTGVVWHRRHTEPMNS